MRQRRPINVFTLSFLDAMTCGFGAIILLYILINAAVGLRAGRMTADLQGEVDRLEVEIRDGHAKLVVLRNSVRETDQRSVVARGRSRRIIDELRQTDVEAATYHEDSLSQREHVNRLKSDLRSLEEDVRRLSAKAPSDETPGDRIRAFVGDGDRQYLTGLKVGGRRILVLLDASSSMLDETLVNVIRRRHLSDDEKRRADKWQRAVASVDWLTTQFPSTSRFQIYAFDTRARPVVPGSDGTWLDAGSREVLEDVVARVRKIVPRGGTSLHVAFDTLRRMNPAPDNVVLLTDGLPTQGRKPPRRQTVSATARYDLYRQAVKELRGGTPINVILFPLEGDPLAASSFWRLAVATGGSFLSPSRDWP